MADLTKGLLNLNLSPEQAVLLDRQAREQQIQQQTQATPDVFRGMLQQAMRTADTLQNVPRALMGERPPMGANQRMAMEAQQARQKEEDKMKSFQSQLSGASDEQLLDIIKDNAIENPKFAQAAKYVLDLQKGTSVGKPSAKIMTDRTNGNSYRVVNDGTGNVTVYKAGTNTPIDPTSIDLVEPTVFNSMQVGLRNLQNKDIEQQTDQLNSVVNALSSSSKQMYNEEVSKLPLNMPLKEKNALKISVALKYSGEDRVKEANLSQDEYVSTMSFVDEKINNITDKRKDLTAITYKAGQFIPGTDAYDVASDISTLQSNAFMSQLMAMKQASANGASGMGQVTEKEVQLLIDSLGNIDPAQSQAQFERNVELFRQRFNDIQAKIAKGKGASGSATFDDLEEAVKAAKARYPNKTEAEIRAVLSQQ